MMVILLSRCRFYDLHYIKDHAMNFGLFRCPSRFYKRWILFCHKKIKTLEFKKMISLYGEQGKCKLFAIMLNKD